MTGHRAAHDMKIAPLLGFDPGDASTLYVDRYGHLFELVSAGAETRTLANPDRPGVLAIVRMKTDGGDITLTAAAGINVAGNTQAVFGDVGDQLLLISVSAASGYRWEILVNTGSVSLS